MNKQNLQQIFSNYIRKFEYINDREHNENYKWFITAKFHNLMDPDHPNFAERIREAGKLSSNLIDSVSRYCFSSLISCASKEPDAVRSLFKALFADDGGDLTVRQRKIDRFITDANALTERLVTTNNMYMNDQRSAMAYLFLNDPDNHYLYKATEANEFASCIEYYNSWGPGTAFHLDVYYRMCDMLVEEIRNCPELIETHKSRYLDKDGAPKDGLHPDNNYHILAFDIIYGAPEFRYKFYEGITFSPITTKERKLHQERKNKAIELQEKFIAAQEKADKFAEAKAYFTAAISVGTAVKHKIFGQGQIVSVDDHNLNVNFPKRGETKPFDPMKSFVEGHLTADIADLPEKIAEYRDVIKEGERAIETALIKAEKDFDEYKEYLD